MLKELNSDIPSLVKGAVELVKERNPHHVPDDVSKFERQVSRITMNLSKALVWFRKMFLFWTVLTTEFCPEMSFSITTTLPQNYTAMMLMLFNETQEFERLSLQF
jgi:hypothetical protein